MLRLSQNVSLHNSRVMTSSMIPEANMREPLKCCRKQSAVLLGDFRQVGGREAPGRDPGEEMERMEWTCSVLPNSQALLQNWRPPLA